MLRERVWFYGNSEIIESQQKFHNTKSDKNSYYSAAGYLYLNLQVIPNK